MLPVVQLPDVLPNVGPPDAGVTLDVHVVSQSQQHLKEKEQIRHRDFMTSHLISHNWLRVMTRWSYLLNLSSQLSGWSEDQSLGLPHLQTENTSQHELRSMVTCVCLCVWGGGGESSSISLELIPPVSGRDTSGVHLVSPLRADTDRKPFT